MRTRHNLYPPCTLYLGVIQLNASWASPQVLQVCEKEQFDLEQPERLLKSKQ